MGAATYPSVSNSATPCCDPWGMVGMAAFIQSGAVMVGAWTTSTAAMVNLWMLEQQTWSIGFSNWKADINKKTGLQKQFSEATISVEQVIDQGLIASEALSQFQPAPMQDQTVTAGLLMGEIGDVTKKRIAADAAHWLEQSTTTTAGGEHPFIKRHKKYCDQQGVDAGLCDELAPAGLQNADINIKTILMPSDGDSLTLSDEEREAGLLFVENITIATPHVLPTTKKNTENYTARLSSDQAALSAAAMSFHAALAHRTRRHGDTSHDEQN